MGYSAGKGVIQHDSPRRDLARWTDLFLAQGQPTVTPLVAGMDGVVCDLGDGPVGKVWFHREVASLQLTQGFQRELAPYRATLAACAGLAHGEASPAAHALPVLDEHTPLWTGHGTQRQRMESLS